MELFKRQPLLVGLLVLLLSIRLVIVPIFDWQNQSLEQTKSLQKKHQKTQVAILREDDNQAQSKKLEVQNTAIHALFFAAGSEAKFKLERQQWLEMLLVRHNFKANNIGWMNSVKVQNAELIKHSLQLGFQGQTINIPTFQSEVENTTEWIEIEGFNTVFVNQNDLELGQVRANYQLNFYQLLSEEKGEQ
jgi:hypothetical protein